MKKTKLIFLAFVLSIKFMNAQTVELGGTNSLKVNGAILALHSDKNGNVYAAGSFQNSQSRRYVEKFDGTSWKELIGLPKSLFAKDDINTITSDNSGNIYVGGKFKDEFMNTDYIVNKFNGSTWSVFAGIDSLKLNGPINCILTDNKGNFYICGGYRNASKKLYIAKFDGSKWIELGGSSTFDQAIIPNNLPQEMKLDNLGNLYVIGLPNLVGKNFIIRKFNGTSWSNILIDTIVCCPPETMEIDSKNNIYISGGVIGQFGKYNVVKYNGTSWTELGGTKSLISYGHINKIICDKFDNVYATVLDSNYKQYIAKYDGTKWNKITVNHKSDYGIGLKTICSNSNGDIYTAGDIANDSSNRFVAKLVAGSSSIINSDLDNNFSIYPNPCSTCVVITSKHISIENLLVTDILGKKISVQFEKSPNGYRINLAPESKGIYFLMNLESGENLRFVKE